MKKYLKIILVPTTSIFVLPIIYSVINLFKIEISPLFYLFSIIIIAFITGILTGFICNEKAYLKGIMVGSILSLIMLILSFILKSNHSFFIIIYYLIIIVSTALGAMVGVNKKKG